MALQLNSQIPLAAIGQPLNPADLIQQAQQNAQRVKADALAQRLAELKADFEARKISQQQAVQSAMGDELSKMTQGTPAIPAQTSTQFVWQQPRQVVDVPEQPAIPAREPTLQDLQQAHMNALFKAGDMQGLLDAMKAAKLQQQKPHIGMVQTGGGQMAVDLNTVEPGTIFPANPAAPAKPDIRLVPQGGGHVAVDMSQVKPGTVFPGLPEKPKTEAITPYQKIQMEKGLRDDYHTDSKAYLEVKRQHALISSALKDPSAAATLAAGTAIMKMLDPGSVVRESELGMAMSASGITDRVMNYANIIASGKVLTAQQRQDFQRLADEFMNQAEKINGDRQAYYRDIAQQYGLQPSHILGSNMQQSARTPAQPRNLLPAVGFMKSQNITSQQQFNSAVQALKASGWTDDEIRQAAAKAGL